MELVRRHGGQLHCSPGMAGRPKRTAWEQQQQQLLRPVFHRLEHRIRAHVLICWLALLLTRVAERGTDQTWRNINRQLGRITQVTLAGPAGTVTQTTPLNAEHKGTYQALSLQPPARVTTFDPT